MRSPGCSRQENAIFLLQCTKPGRSLLVQPCTLVSLTTYSQTLFRVARVVLGAHSASSGQARQLCSLAATAAEDDRPEPLQEYVARGRSWKFMAVIEHAVKRGATADGGEGGTAGGVFGNEIVDMLIGLYQVRLIDDTKHSELRESLLFCLHDQFRSVSTVFHLLQELSDIPPDP